MKPTPSLGTFQFHLCLRISELDINDNKIFKC